MTGRRCSVRSWRLPAAVLTTLAGKTVSAANLRLFTSGQGSCGTGAAETIQASRIASAFNAGWTWNAHPAAVGATVDTIFNPAIGQFCTGAQYGNVNILPIAQDWASGAYTQRTIRLAAAQEGTNLSYKRFIALENGGSRADVRGDLHGDPERAVEPVPGRGRDDRQGLPGHLGDGVRPVRGVGAGPGVRPGRHRR